MFNASFFIRCRGAAVAEIGAKGAEDGSGHGFDRHAPGADESQCQRQVTKLGPFIVGPKVRGLEDASRRRRWTSDELSVRSAFLPYQFLLVFAYGI